MYILVATPRSGSNWIGSALDFYFRRKFQYQPWLVEPFFISWPNFGYEYNFSGGLITRNDKRIVVPDVKVYRDTMRTYIENSYGQYFFKVMVDELADKELYEWLDKRYTWIFLNRIDKYEQALSYLLFCSGLAPHYHLGNISSFPTENMYVKPIHLNDFLDRTIKFKETYNQHGSENAIVLNYEDVLNNFDSEICKLFPDFFEYVGYWEFSYLSMKTPYTRGKLNHIKNRSEIEALLDSKSEFFKEYAYLK